MGLFSKENKAGQVDLNNLPCHVAVIMDGNGRWAQKRGLPRSAGHKAGAETFRKLGTYCKNLGIDYLTVYAFSTENWKRPKDEVLAQARELLAKMGLAGKEDMVPCELSGGQQQRVAIARALALNPDVLFFDEPTSALDPELTKGVLKVIRDLADEHMTMVIVTHEMSFARDVADHIIFMDGGYIVEEGPAEQVINNPQHDRTKAFLANYGD